MTRELTKLKAQHDAESDHTNRAIIDSKMESHLSQHGGEERKLISHSDYDHMKYSRDNWKQLAGEWEARCKQLMAESHPLPAPKNDALIEEIRKVSLDTDYSDSEALAKITILCTRSQASKPLPAPVEEGQTNALFEIKEGRIICLQCRCSNPLQFGSAHYTDCA